ncbi:lytic transglycosylase domain-containing protein [Pandoraea sp. PE-S2T-3]|uniref:lytic transglycosylase domain-containing protein n=1 Tax=Pandoraea sp. PE-S2T-3 TaxID=1986993 RepID=UPI0020CC322C|nr:lytic transglycosylase domain-containing protein [Pandoraea sp. PE-S2T-3]
MTRSTIDVWRWRVRMTYPVWVPGVVLAVGLIHVPLGVQSAQDRLTLPSHPRMAEAGIEVPVRRAVPVAASASAHEAEASGVDASGDQDDEIEDAPSPSLPFDALVQTTANDLSLDAALLHAIVNVESGYDALAVSRKGAIGLMQVRPQTGARFGFRRLEDPAENLRAGATYLQWLLTRFDGDLSLALAAYNAGEGAVLRYGRKIPPYPETQGYVRKVMAGYSRLVAARVPVTAAERAPVSARKVGVAAAPPENSRAWQLLRGLGALITRSPSDAPDGGAALQGRDAPAVAVPAKRRPPSHG